MHEDCFLAFHIFLGRNKSKLRKKGRNYCCSSCMKCVWVLAGDASLLKKRGISCVVGTFLYHFQSALGQSRSMSVSEGCVNDTAISV